MTSSIRRALAVRLLMCASVTGPSLGGHGPAFENLFRMQKQDASLGQGRSRGLLPVGRAISTARISLSFSRSDVLRGFCFFSPHIYDTYCHKVTLSTR